MAISYNCPVPLTPKKALNLTRLLYTFFAIFLSEREGALR